MVAERVFTTEQAADLLQIHRETFRRKVRAGEIRVMRIGRTMRISEGELRRWWRDHGGGSLFPGDLPGPEAFSAQAELNRMVHEIGNLEKVVAQLTALERYLTDEGKEILALARRTLTESRAAGKGE